MQSLNDLTSTGSKEKPVLQSMPCPETSLTSPSTHTSPEMHFNFFFICDDLREGSLIQNFIVHETGMEENLQKLHILCQFTLLKPHLL